MDAPQIERDYGIAHGAMALAVLTLPQLLAALVEARLVSWAAAHGDPRRWIAAGQALVCACALVGAVAASPWVLALALAVAGPASGVAGSLAVARLVEGSACAERAMTRWSLAGALGDLAVPVLVGAVAWAGLPWRASLVAVAALLGAHAVAALHSPALPTGLASAEQERRNAVTLGRALRTPRLLAWLLGLTACTLLDEILVAFAALHLRQGLGASEAATALALFAWALGWALGLLATERLLARIAPRRLLAVASLACAAVVLAWLLANETAVATLGLFVLGVTTAPLYPIAQAQAFAACPGRAVLVELAGRLFAPLEIALPLLIGLLADAWGVEVALAALVLQPLTLFILACLARPRGQ